MNAVDRIATNVEQLEDLKARTPSHLHDHLAWFLIGALINRCPAKDFADACATANGCVKGFLMRDRNPLGPTLTAEELAHLNALVFDGEIATEEPGRGPGPILI